MNKKVIKRWIKALRSGSYAQCVNYLKSGEKFCATGVLCDLHSKEFKIEWEELKNCDSYIDEPYSPPDTVYDWAGIDAIQSSRVMSWNDLSHLSFNQIADKLEEIINE